MKTNEQAMERVNGGWKGDQDREREHREEGIGMEEERYCMWWHGCERKEMECRCQVREFLSAASDRSLRRTGTQTGLLLATGEALAASLAVRETYLWVYTVCGYVCF